MIPDHARMLENLNRTARTAGHDTILETWKLKRLLAGTELAEAMIAAIDAEVPKWRSAQEALDAAEAAYRIARTAPTR